MKMGMNSVYQFTFAVMVTTVLGLGSMGTPVWCMPLYTMWPPLEMMRTKGQRNDHSKL